MDENYAYVGEDPIDKQSKKAFVFDIDNELPPICPKDYFITTGEAIEKFDYMVKQIKNTLDKCEEIRKKLVKTKGESNWLETCWENNNLLVKKKESRSKK